MANFSPSLLFLFAPWFCGRIKVAACGAFWIAVELSPTFRRLLENVTAKGKMRPPHNPQFPIASPLPASSSRRCLCLHRSQTRERERQHTEVNKQQTSMPESMAAERPNIPINTNFGVGSCEVKLEAQNRQTDLLDCIALSGNRKT